MTDHYCLSKTPSTGVETCNLKLRSNNITTSRENPLMLSTFGWAESNRFQHLYRENRIAGTRIDQQVYDLRAGGTADSCSGE